MRLDDHAHRTFMLGASHVAAVAMPDGRPLALRGWGAALDDTTNALRVLLARRDLEVGDATPSALTGGWIAYTSTDVRTFASIQVKGRARRVEPAGAADHSIHERYCDEYFEAVVEVDLFARALLERLRPGDLVAVELDVEEVYDQSPGPAAGRVYGGPG